MVISLEQVEMPLERQQKQLQVAQFNLVELCTQKLLINLKSSMCQAASSSIGEFTIPLVANIIFDS